MKELNIKELLNLREAVQEEIRRRRIIAIFVRIANSLKKRKRSLN